MAIKWVPMWTLLSEQSGSKLFHKILSGYDVVVNESTKFLKRTMHTRLYLLSDI